MAGLRLPLVTRNLQAFVSMPIKPVVDVIVNCPDTGVYLMQSDKVELVTKKIGSLMSFPSSINSVKTCRHVRPK